MTLNETRRAIDRAMPVLAALGEVAMVVGAFGAAVILRGM